MRTPIPLIIAMLLGISLSARAQDSKAESAAAKDKEVVDQAHAAFDKLVAEARTKLDESLQTDKERLAKMSSEELQLHVKEVLRGRSGPSKEAMERYGKLSDDAKQKLRKSFEENRDKIQGMSPEDRRKFMEDNFKKIADEDAAKKPGSADKPKSDKPAEPEKKN